jgi:hypothetical protein
MSEQSQMDAIIDILDQQQRQISVLAKRCDRFEAHGMAIALVFQALSGALQVRGAISRDELVVLMQTLIERTERIGGKPPEAIEYLRAIQKGLMLDQSPGTTN